MALLTQEEFETKIRRKNPEILIKVVKLGEYTGSEKYIICGTYYGKVRIMAKTMYSRKRFSTNCAVNKTQYFINIVSEKHMNRYVYPKTEYIDDKEYITVTCPTHGDFSIMAQSHLNGRGCRKCGKTRCINLLEKTQEEFLELLKKTNLEAYKELEFLEEYKGYNKQILARNRYGVVYVVPGTLYKGSCPSIRSAIDPTAYIIAMFKEKHGNRYDYSLVKYVEGNIDVLIICPIHGVFPQRPNGHLNMRNCTTCAMQKGVWGRTEYEDMAKGREVTCYIINCFNNQESFTKIGISLNVKKRFSGKVAMPYKYKIIREIKGNAGEMWDLEHTLHRSHSKAKLKYTPLIEFKGDKECFTKILPDEIINKTIEEVKQKQT